MFKKLRKLHYGWSDVTRYIILAMLFGVIYCETGIATLAYCIINTLNFESLLYVLRKRVYGGKS